MAVNKIRLDQASSKLADAIFCALTRWAGVTRFSELAERLPGEPK
ncbi:hypothetical protein [Bradyrhizobium sp. USDA 3364]